MLKLIKILNLLEEGLLAFILTGLSVFAFIEVICRYLFNHSFTWFEELSRYLSVFMTFLGASLGVKYGYHFSMDFFITRVSPRVANLMRSIYSLISSGFFLLLVYVGWIVMMKLKRFGATSAAMKLPMFWIYLPIVVFSFTMSFRFVIHAWQYAIAFIRNTSGPVMPGRKKSEEPECS